MKITSLLLALAFTHTAFADVPLERWRSYTGVTWSAPAPYADSAKSPIAGLHFDAQGGGFVSTPRVLAANTPATLSRLDTSVTDGPARLTAFPSAEANDPTTAPATHLRSVLGFHIDRRNGWLWALDQGFVAGEAEAPAGAQKVLVFELATGKLVKAMPLDSVANRRGSFLNDIAVDEKRRIAFISDSGLRSAPANQAALIVLDFASGNARRVLHRHAGVLPEPGAKVMSHGAEVWPGNPLMLGVNGIGLSPDGATLYWAVTTGTHLFSVPAALLRNAKTTEAQLAAAVRDLGDVGGNTDGLVVAADGRVYITNVTRNGIVGYDPRDGRFTLVGADDGVHWPDTPALLPNGDLVFTASSLNDHFAGRVAAGQERYELWKFTPAPRQ
ncbi:L-dopachrome tautomerase-related protein [Roseateles sp. NT4]|uniref:L-dopachrome tautomerase-related protein n=1 Tax=Roseateles sp. NT4 TaxID=3453715 RepID=UPI003EF07A70